MLQPTSAGYGLTALSISGCSCNNNFLICYVA